MPNFWRKRSKSRLLDEVVDFFFGSVGVCKGTTGGALVVTSEPVESAHVETSVTHVVVVPVAKSSRRSSSRSKSSSSPVSSCKAQVSSKKMPVISRTTHVSSSISPLREKWVPMLVLENDFKS